ncbi:MAG: formylglycine-generating enzyme family protein [Bacteroidetes bacterium]|nr:formylglycine-generating enzyme family protein [Bacteroidota bacterium]
MNFPLTICNGFKIKRSLLFCVSCFWLLPKLVISQENLPLDLKFIPGGDFGMQVYDSLTGATKTRLTHPVKDFYLSATELSVQDFQAFCKATKRAMPPAPAWGWDDPKLPVVNVNYEDAVDYCRWLYQKYSIPFRLPEWDEWEYAAREGDFDPRESTEVDSNQIVYAGNSNEKPQCTTCMQANNLGLYATAGNVWEWVTKTTFYTTDSLFYIQDARQETLWAGGSFFEDATQVQPGVFRPISGAARRQDVGFRVAVDAVEYKKALLLQKINALLNQIFEDQSVMANSAGIYTEEMVFLWQDIPGDTALSYDVETSEVFFCCVSAFDPEQEVTTWSAVGYKVPQQNSDWVFDLMHLLNVEPGNLSLLKE